MEKKSKITGRRWQEGLLIGAAAWTLLPLMSQAAEAEAPALNEDTVQEPALESMTMTNITPPIAAEQDQDEAASTTETEGEGASTPSNSAGSGDAESEAPSVSEGAEPDVQAEVPSAPEVSQPNAITFDYFHSPRDVYLVGEEFDRSRGQLWVWDADQPESLKPHRSVAMTDPEVEVIGFDSSQATDRQEVRVSYRGVFHRDPKSYPVRIYDPMASDVFYYRGPVGERQTIALPVPNDYIALSAKPYYYLRELDRVNDRIKWMSLDSYYNDHKLSRSVIYDRTGGKAWLDVTPQRDEGTFLRSGRQLYEIYGLRWDGAQTRHERIFSLIVDGLDPQVTPLYDNSAEITVGTAPVDQTTNLDFLPAELSELSTHFVSEHYSVGEFWQGWVRLPAKQVWVKPISRSRDEYYIGFKPTQELVDQLQRFTTLWGMKPQMIIDEWVEFGPGGVRVVVDNPEGIIYEDTLVEFNIRLEGKPLAQEEPFKIGYEDGTGMYIMLEMTLDGCVFFNIELGELPKIHYFSSQALLPDELAKRPVVESEPESQPEDPGEGERPEPEGDDSQPSDPPNHPDTPSVEDTQVPRPGAAADNSVVTPAPPTVTPSEEGARLDALTPSQPDRLVPLHPGATVGGAVASIIPEQTASVSSEELEATNRPRRWPWAGTTVTAESSAPSEDSAENQESLSLLRTSTTLAGGAWTNYWRDLADFQMRAAAHTKQVVQRPAIGTRFMSIIADLFERQANFGTRGQDNVGAASSSVDHSAEESQAEAAVQARDEASESIRSNTLMQSASKYSQSSELDTVAEAEANAAQEGTTTSSPTDQGRFLWYGGFALAVLAFLSRRRH